MNEDKGASRGAGARRAMIAGAGLLALAACAVPPPEGFYVAGEPLPAIVTANLPADLNRDNLYVGGNCYWYRDADGVVQPVVEQTRLFKPQVCGPPETPGLPPLTAPASAAPDPANAPAAAPEGDAA